MANVYGYWKCPSCGTIIRGDNRTCPNCGTAIPANVKYLPPNAPEVIEAIGNGRAVNEFKEYVPPDKVSMEANWICEYCETQNPASATTCAGCGSARFEANKNYFGEQLRYSEEDRKQREFVGLSNEPESPCDVSPYDDPSPPPPISPSTSYRSDYTSPYDTTYDMSPEPPHPRSPFRIILEWLKNYWTYLAASCGVLVVLFFVIWLFIPVERTATITDFEWNRSIAVEEYKLCNEDDWSLPRNAELSYTREEIHHYNSVLDHYETKTRQVAEQEFDGYDVSYRDLGNGQFEEVKTERYKTVYREETYEEPVYIQVPEYRTKYYYTIGRWKEVDSLVTQGSDQSPYWHECDYPRTVSDPDYGDKRRGGTSENYYAVITSEDGTKNKVKYGYSEWSELNIGDTITYKSFRFTDKPL